MKHIEVTDELLYKYMPIADEMELDALEAELDDDIEPSEQFQKKMKRLIWKEKHRWLVDFGKFMAKVAVVLLCISGLSLAVTMSVDAYRSKFFQTVQEFLDDSVKHSYDTGEDEQGFVPHEPTYIPEGYVELERIITDNMVSIYYTNNEGEEIYWDQMLASNGKDSISDLEYETQSIVKTKEGVLVICTYSDGYVRAYLEKDKYIYVLNANNLNDDVIQYIFESIE